MSDPGSVATSTIAGSAISFGLGFGIALLAEGYKKKTAKDAAIQSVKKELEAIKTSLEKRINERPKPEDAEREFRTGRFDITIFQLSHNAFDSLLYSGVYRDLTVSEQVTLSGLYNDIKFANEMQSRFIQVLSSVYGEATPAFVQTMTNIFRSMIEGEKALAKKIEEDLAKI